MGTNYYYHEKSPCPTCGHTLEPRHIGKSSAGWVFALHVYPDEGIRDIDDWVERWSREDAYIVDEYGKRVSQDEMLLTIMARIPTVKPEPGPQWFVDNQASRGPFGLARSIVDGKRCIGHGQGTYDRRTGEFS